MTKLMGLGLIGLAVFIGAIVTELTRKAHQQTSVRPGE